MDLTTLLIALLVLCIVCAVAYWLIQNLMPEPMRKFAIAILLVIVVIVLISYLTGNLNMRIR